MHAYITLLSGNYILQSRVWSVLLSVDLLIIIIAPQAFSDITI